VGVLYQQQKSFVPNHQHHRIVDGARTIVIGEGTTHVYEDRGSHQPRLVYAMGCEGVWRHGTDGSNFGFGDSHAKYLNSNSQFVLDSQEGQWFAKYYSWDK